MGQSFLFSCNKCNHALNSSGEFDYGMRIVVKPYICSSCNDVVDVSVGKFGKIIPKTMLTESQKKEFNH